MIINQAYLFLAFAINGVIIGLLFDFFRILRKTFNTSNFITYIEDVLFWIFTGISIIIFMYKVSDGSIRLFMFIGITLGFLIYILTISKFIIKFFVFIIGFFKRVFSYVVSIFRIPIKFVIKSSKNIIGFFYKIFHKISHFFAKKTKNQKKFKYNSKNVKKNVNKKRNLYINGE